ncbi:MAG: hypothetical protein ACQEUT_06350 [Bacillota bacterium]
MLERGIQRSSFQASKASYPSKLTDGQVIFGKVNKLLPEGMAEINYKGQLVIAKLETPLNAGSHYLFQTELSEEGILKLKVISSPQTEVKSSFSALAEKLMNDLQLPRRGNVRELAGLMLKHSHPFTKEELLRMNELLAGTTDKQAGIQALMKLKGQNLVTTRNLYHSILQGNNMEPLSVLMDDLESALQKNNAMSMENKEILKILAGIKETENRQLFQKTVNKSMITALDAKTDQTGRLSALKLLQMIGIIPEGSTLGEMKSVVGDGGQSPKVTGSVIGRSIDVQPVLIKDKLTVLSELLSAVKAPAERSQLLLRDIQSAIKSLDSGLKNSQEILKQAAELIRRGEVLVTQRGTIPQLSENDKFNLLYSIHSGKEQPLLKGFLSMIEKLKQNQEPELPALKALQQIVAADGGNTARIHKENLPDIIKDILARLGMNQEAKLAAGFPAERSTHESLKPALIALLNDLPQGNTRDTAEKLLFKLNGQAVLSGDSGPMQTVVYQVPLSWQSQRNDLTIQWTGRKTESGRVDSEHCRVLFYLELKTIKEVIVDMSVQNRVITLNIYNDTPQLKKLSAPFSANMKEGLEKLGYKLSLINFKEPAASASPKKIYRELAGDVSYTGVDLKA